MIRTVSCWSLRLVLLAFLLFGVASPLSAQDSDTRKELWPELDVFIPLHPKFRLVVIASFTKVEESRDNQEGAIQVSLDYIPHKKLTLRNGYRYAFSLSGADPYKEHRIIFEQYFRHRLPLDVVVSDRNREEIRVVNGTTSGGYRNRLGLEREFQTGPIDLIPYSSFEMYYDTRFDTWNRNRLNVGVQVPLRRGFPLVTLLDPTRQITLNVYYSRQNDTRSSPRHVHALGLGLYLYF